MIHLSVTLPPLTAREALRLSDCFDLLNTLLWEQYGDAMIALLKAEGKLVPELWWSIDQADPNL